MQITAVSATTVFCQIFNIIIIILYFHSNRNHSPFRSHGRTVPNILGEGHKIENINSVMQLE